MCFTSRTIIVALMLLTTKLFKSLSNADEPALVMLEYGDEDLYVFPFCARETWTGIDYSINELPQYIPAYYCPPKEEKDFPTGCLLRKSRKEPPTCDKEVQLDLLKTPTQKLCGLKNVKLYSFGYQLCQPHLNQMTGNLSFTARFIELFDVCYDHDNKRLRHISYKINSPNLLYHKTLQTEVGQLHNITLNTSDFNIENLGDRNEQIKKFYDSINQNSNYQGKDSVELIQVVSPKHMAFPLWQKSLYYYINVQPMRKHLAELWDRINEYIVQKAVPLFGSISIKTGFRYENDNPMPTLWWKSLRDEKDRKGMLIFIHDIEFSAQTLIEKRICEESKCDSYGWKGLILDNEKHFAYCCPPETFNALHNFSTQSKLKPLKLEKNENSDKSVADNKFELAEKHCKKTTLGWLARN